MPAPKQTKKTNPPTTNQKPTSTNAAQASASTPTAPKPKKKTNEIDDIFGRKETLPAPAPTEEPAETKDDTPTPQPTLSKKQKKKLKDGNSGSDSTPVAATATAPNSAPKVETVEFKVPEIPVHRKRPREGDDDDDDGFADSRGTKGRRKTEDGLSIFTVEELEIGKGGEMQRCRFILGHNVLTRFAVET